MKPYVFIVLKVRYEATLTLGVYSLFLHGKAWEKPCVFQLTKVGLFELRGCGIAKQSSPMLQNINSLRSFFKQKTVRE